MALQSIRLLNFKCFADSGGVPLAPLTVIFGRNNSGKSSILQSLLLLRQTFDSPEYGPRLNLRGPLYPAGSYADLVHQHRSRNNIQMQFRINRTEETVPFLVEMEFSSDEPQPPRLGRLRIEGAGAEPLEIRRGRGAGGPYNLVIGGRQLGAETKANFRFPVNRFLPLIGGELPHRGRPSTTREQARGIARHALFVFERILTQMRAVGAFRQQPDRRYEYQGRVPQIDAAGQNVVNALIEDATRRRNRGELLRSVNQWLRMVGRVRLMPLRRISRAARIFEVRLKDTDSGRWANFADVGFGIGQALPVIVEGLRTPIGGLFLVQEPEIHLHPNAQMAMADFLITLARQGRCVIAETHSEHLLLRIRRSIVQQPGAKRKVPRLQPDQVSIVHVDKKSDGSSHARGLHMDELGQVPKWPAGFMEEATQERMAILHDIARQKK